MVRTSEFYRDFEMREYLIGAVDIRPGMNHGRPTTAIPKAARPSQRKGVTSTKTKFVRSIVREVAGFSAYERRVMELLRNSKVGIRIRGYGRIILIYDDTQDKKARKLTKKRVRFAEGVRMTNEGFIARNVVAIEAQTRGVVDDYPGEQTGALKSCSSLLYDDDDKFEMENASRG